MLATPARSRSRNCCLSSAFGSFWRAAIRNSPESAKRVAKSEVDFDSRKNQPTTLVPRPQLTSDRRANPNEQSAETMPGSQQSRIGGMNVRRGVRPTLPNIQNAIAIEHPRSSQRLRHELNCKNNNPRQKKAARGAAF
jgi:hypothetical protein